MWSIFGVLNIFLENTKEAQRFCKSMCKCPTVFCLLQVVQTEGEVVWTFCLGIHGGFNSGANAGVAMNILLHWCLPFLRQLVFDLDEFCNCEENNKTTFSMTKAEYLSLETKACRYHARSAVTEPGVKSLPAPEVQEPPALQVCAVCKAVGSNMRTDLNRLRGTRKLLAGKPVCGPCRNRNQPETRFHKCYICNCSRLKNLVFRPYVYPAPGTPENHRFICNNCRAKYKYKIEGWTFDGVLLIHISEEQPGPSSSI
ncbi:uncharacterized protein [Bemisia tabaci]|uniref:uncharacterized protein isoform X2 n=1 Tax=Bemisia tabaci TaxID=7038 RepID=UPI003B2807B8